MSPYIIGSPIDRPEMLYGRDGILTDIKLQLPPDRRANIILLEGNRRTGKTSILKRLETPGELPGWIVVNTNLQGAKGREGRAGVTSLEIFRLLTQDLALALVKAGVPVWLPDVPQPDPKRHFELQLRKALDAYFNDDHPFELYEIYLKTVFQAVAPRRVMLMIDEFDTIQEGIDAGTTSPKVPENLRYLFHRHPELGGILSGSRRLTRLRNEYWSALFGIGVAIRVGPLAEEDARALVTQPVAGRLVYAAEARDRIVTLCACQPFLIQTLCNRIFKEAHARGERTILLDAVERAATEMTSDNEHFETLWGYARTERRRLILALLCELVRGSEGRPLDAGTLEQELLDQGVAVPESGLGDDIAHLRELELIALETHDGYQRYRLTSPLLAEWIQRNKDFSDLAQRAISEENAGRE
jgi:type I restriction enzyme M protein